MRHTAILLAMCAALSAGLATAQTPSSGQRSGPPSGGTPPAIPAEAYTACQGKSAGDAVTLTTPDGRTMKATCDKAPGDSRLAARPSEPPPDGKR